MFGLRKPLLTKTQKRETYLDRHFHFMKDLSEYLKHRTHRRDLGLEPVPRMRRRRGLKRKE
jgi:hypothetical protein